MPQGGRKVPFSGKAKKQQLQAKKNRKVAAGIGGRGDDSDNDTKDEFRVQKLNAQPSTSNTSQANRYALHFKADSKEEDKKRKEEARKALVYLPESALEIEADTPYPEGLDFPIRPQWNFKMTREQLDAQEQKYFRQYVDNLGTKFGWSELSYFEMNLETWRQLWRVLEMSDILLFIVDIRFPVYLFPPSLYEHVTKTLNKNMILILNKIDLAPAPLVLAWKHYFQSNYHDLQVLLFTAFPGYNMRSKGKRRGKLRMASEGALEILNACEKVAGDKVDLSSWHRKISEEIHTEYEDDEVEVGETLETEADTGYFQHESFKEGILTIGCVGQPNVGKSSLMNAIMGKKVVSVSKTPGHTKHFQTIFLTSNVRLCDCPGLVFPSKVPKTLQVLMGSYPIAQLREPYSSIQYLAERINLISQFKLHHPENDEEWSAFDICEAWAIQRGFLTAKTARPDAYRSANHLLRLALDGKICLCLYPPNYTINKEKWLQHEELKTVLEIQAKSNDNEDTKVAKKQDEESNESSEEEVDAHDNVTTNKFALLADDD